MSEDKKDSHGNGLIRVGIVSYLNTRPLIYGLRRPPINSLVELIEETPAKLADMLRKDEIDLGLIPIAAIPSLKEYHIVSDYCIGAEAEVASVCLFSEVPLEEIERVYLDYQSRTSVALLQWLMKEYWGISPVIMNSENEDYRKEIKGTTAGLVIGDRALEQRKLSTYIYDLGQAWRSVTGLPFVFAAWVSNKPIPGEFIKLFNEANALGLTKIEEIVTAHPYDIYDLKKYYSIHISYPLDERKRRGMELFLKVITE